MCETLSQKKKNVKLGHVADMSTGKVSVLAIFYFNLTQARIIG